LALSSSLGLLLICSCNGLNKEGKYEINSSLFMGCDTILKGKKIGVKDLPLYKIDTSFYTFLDSIVVSESKCPFYNECTSCFSFTFVERFGVSEIQITSDNIYRYDYSKCHGLFEYKGRRFICDSLYNADLLHKTSEIITVKYLIFDRSHWANGGNERYTTWFFEYENKNILFKGHHKCF
jgi:hypothetical protein